MLRTIAIGTAAAAALIAMPASAAVNLVTNGDFSQYSAQSSQQMSADSSQGGKQYVTGWTNSYADDKGTAGYNFIMTSVASATSAKGVQTNDYGPISLWGNNGFTDSSSVGGSGGSFLAADGAYERGLIYQVVSGLVVGQKYDLSFNWAAAQQSGYYTSTTDNWTAVLGTNSNDVQSFTTGTVTNPAKGFTGWMTANTTFTATSTSEVLGFFATGTPDGQPPFALLDDVSLTAQSAVPEPASWAMMLCGFGLLGTTLRSKRRARVNMAI